MRTRGTRPLAAVVVLTLGSTGRADAGGFYVPEIGTRAAGLGAAVVADVVDPSAVFHNPAGLAGDDGIQIELGSGLFFPGIEFYRRPVTDPNTGDDLRFDRVENQNTVIAAPFLGATVGLGRGVTGGLAVYAPFGATLEYPVDGAQRQIVTSIALRTIFVSPAVAVALPRGWSVGVAANLIYGDLALEQRNALPYVTGDPEQYPDPGGELEGNTRLEGHDPFSVGATLGAGWRSAGGRIPIGRDQRAPAAMPSLSESGVNRPK